jgi:hypothetical protein
VPSPTNAVDTFACDDPKMAEQQHTILDAVKELAMTILGVFAGRP